MTSFADRCRGKFFAALGLFAVALLPLSQAADKKVLLIAGPPSHGPGAHEHNAGMLLLQKCLKGFPGLKTEISLNGWPKNPSAFDQVDAVIIYSDGGPRHIALADDHLDVLRKVVAKGTGIGLLHYATEPTLEKGHREFLQWVGGAFEVHWSVNPHWDGNFKNFPNHPVSRGVKAFSVRDEWYYHLRFAEGLKGVTPLLVDKPGPSTLTRKDDAHAGNPAVRASVARGESQTVAWAFNRPDGGRGFGFTGGHFHENWGNDHVRKLVLNAIVWLAKIEVPAGGVTSRVTPADLKENLDPVGPTGKKITPTAKP